MVTFQIRIKLLGIPIDQRQNADFRGTITYASINAHIKKVRKRVTMFLRISQGGMICGASIL